ncbi:NADH dehydrogenase [ubiquinone] 1 beta subcomplex subunit 7 [Smittium culicis]|uniref:NADH dehydrogenase [ubiquinone] 1 beta subcomplex subunit 7 n=1 Tax=Smittium culicis TaxID=133412 RepID=A0A1R1XTX2_9FUNG|nr:NADH dehydrogenase [ubiquinone] 1 beta subcomplex subunit 7 [Smittium culicis]
MKVTQQEMAEARLPLAYRDYCAHLLIPLNRCRIKKLWMPWECVEERHAHEKCEYEDFMRRSRIMTKLKEAKKEQISA